MARMSAKYGVGGGKPAPVQAPVAAPQPVQPPVVQPSPPAPLGLRGIATGGLDRRMAAAKFVATMATAPDIASKLIGIGIDAQSKLISSASQFYAADANAKEMISKVQQYNNSILLDADTKNQAAELEVIKLRADAMARYLQSLGQQATSLFNNLHASVSMSTGGNTTMSTNPA